MMHRDSEGSGQAVSGLPPRGEGHCESDAGGRSNRVKLNKCRLTSFWIEGNSVRMDPNVYYNV